jgi:flagellar basal-body rod modification protein FlgD
MATTTATTNTTATTTATTSKSTASRTVLNANFDTFLKMLTAQLKNQDPTSPMDTAQFTNQLVMYSQVEQQLSTNDKLDSMLNFYQTQASNSALGYLGYDVKVDSRALSLQNSEGRFSVTADGASRINIAISDATTGKTVKTIVLGAEDIDGELIWNGTDNNGNQLEDGTYTLLVAATDAAGKTVTSKVYSHGVVSGIDVDANGNAVLKIGDVLVSPDDVRSVKYYSNPTTPPADDEESEG